VSRLYQADRRARESFLAGIEARQRLYDFPPQVVIETTAACNLK
jgi:hypothetical protein